MRATLDQIATQVLSEKKCMGCLNIFSDSQKDGLCTGCLDSLSLIPEMKMKDDLKTLVYTSYSNKCVQHLLYQVKFNGNRQALSILQSQLLKTPFIAPQCDLAIPIPLHPSKQRERGFNQAKELFLPVLSHNAIPMYAFLKRQKQTLPLSYFEHEERADHLNKSFAWTSRLAESLIIGQTVLLVDDIITTGSTLKEAANMLHNAGAKEVLCAVIAH